MRPSLVKNWISSVLHRDGETRGTFTRQRRRQRARLRYKLSKTQDQGCQQILLRRIDSV